MTKPSWFSFRLQLIWGGDREEGRIRVGELGETHLLLMTRQSEDTGDVVVLTGFLFFGEIPDHVEPVEIVLRHHVKQKRVWGVGV